MVKDANGKTLFISDAQYQLHKARQEQLNNAGNGKHLAVHTGEEGSDGAKVTEKFMTAEAIANDPKLAAAVTKQALKGMQEELIQAKKDYDENGNLKIHSPSLSPSANTAYSLTPLVPRWFELVSPKGRGYSNDISF